MSSSWLYGNLENKEGVTPSFTNRLIEEKSPYLLQHAHNPVDWYTWGKEAFTKAESKENDVLKGTRNIFNKNRENMTIAQLKYLNEKLELKGLRLKTVRAFHLRESFQEIYQSETKNEFISRLEKWYSWASHCRIRPMQETAKTIKEHWDGVIRWYDSRINNGILEGLNSLIQSAKSKARGFRTFKNFMVMIYLVTGDLDFTKVNSHYQPLT